MSAAAPVFTEFCHADDISAAVSRHDSLASIHGGDFKVKEMSPTEDFLGETKRMAYDAFLSDTHKFETGAFRPPRFRSWKTLLADFERFLRWRTEGNTALFKAKKQAGTCMVRYNFTGYTPSEDEVRHLLTRLKGEGDLAILIERIGRENCATDCLGASYYSGTRPVTTKKGVVIKEGGMHQIAVFLGCINHSLVGEMEASMAGPTI